MKNLHNAVERLIIEFALTDCEAGDLSLWAETLAVCVDNKCGNWHCILTEGDAMTHLEIRAEVLAKVGSEMEEMYSQMEEWGKERKEK